MQITENGLKTINLSGFLSALNNQGEMWLSVRERADISFSCHKIVMSQKVSAFQWNVI